MGPRQPSLAHGLMRRRGLARRLRRCSVVSTIAEAICGLVSMVAGAACELVNGSSAESAPRQMMHITRGASQVRRLSVVMRIVATCARGTCGM